MGNTPIARIPSLKRFDPSNIYSGNTMKKKEIKKPTSGRKVADVPIIMQLEALECGAASLSMVMAYYGKWVPLEQVRVDCGVSRNGSNAKNIGRAAQK